ncbi:MAG TPA: hypothetical protein PLW01_09795 [Agitococcus sp.]|nr:hypothetical protein [Agitococcus sp.]
MSDLLLKNFSNALPEQAQGGADVSAIYVSRAANPDQDVVANLHQCISWSENPVGDVYLFSGLRGAGKTTELNRLITELKNDDIAAYYCDASLYLNLHEPNLTLPELLMTVLAGLSDAVKKQHGADFFKDSVWQRVKRTLNSDVNIKPKAKIGAGGAELEIEASLQENPDFKADLITFAKQSGQFYDEVSQFASEIATLIRKKQPDKKIVLVVDSLERLSAPTGQESQLYDTLKELFFHNPAKLALPFFSVVYTAPPYLPIILPSVEHGFAESFILSNFKVINKEGTRCEQGIAQMVDIIDKRFDKWSEVMAKPVLESLAWLSGGNVRRFFALVKTAVRKIALSRQALPITDPSAAPITQAINEIAQPLQWLTGTDRNWLRYFKTDEPSQNIQDLAKDVPVIIRLFDHSLVLNYKNGKHWYSIPPLVHQYVSL